MKKVRRTLALFLAAALIVSLTACNNVGGWIMKTEDNSEVPVGAYIINLYNEFWTAKSKVSDTSASPLGQTIEEKQGDQWIKDQALKDTERIATVLNKCKELDVTLTDDEKKTLQSSVDNTWDSYGETYEKMGVSKDSLKYYNEYSKLTNKLFEKIYGAGGSSALTDAEVKEYFEKNYVSFKYLPVSLTNDSGTEFSQEDKDKVKANLQTYLDSYMSGTKTFSEIEKDYNAEHANATITGKEVITDLENSTLADEIKEAVKDTEAGKGTIVISNKTMYLILKYDITKESTYLTDNRTSVMYSMRGEEFDKMLEDEVSKVKYELNDGAVNKYSPSWIEGLGI